jgi:hypothetical protein
MNFRGSTRIYLFFFKEKLRGASDPSTEIDLINMQNLMGVSAGRLMFFDLIIARHFFVDKCVIQLTVIKSTN